MKDKKSIEFSKKISEGLRESNQKLIEKTKKNKSYLVVSRNNKIERINSEFLPENISDVKTKYN
ncbi:MAG: hypothetical protein J0M18_19660 [Ignavibacteria bacterium]|jgi:hypothetical protein|nr:hypothetical protein [Ignavibacteria bacterium]